MIPPPQDVDMTTGVRMLDEFREWAESELDKIFLSARLIGVSVIYRPGPDASGYGLRPRGDGDCSGTCQVRHQALMGHLYFYCDMSTLENKIRVPGINAEYRNYAVDSEEVTSVLDQNGEIRGYAAFGHYKIFVGHPYDHCKI